MKRALFSIFILVCALALVLPLRAENKKDDHTAKLQDIRRLLEVTGSSKIGEQAFNQIVNSFKQTMTNVPAEFWTEAIKGFKPDELVDLIVPIYDKYLTHKDIKDLIKFYDTPVGKKFVSVQPQIMQESMAAGQQWGQQLAQKVLLKLQEKGYKK
jgi:hypothetical protein